MMLGRRGFLHTLAAAAVGAATFEPKGLLWMPAAPASIVPVELTGTTAQAVIAEQLELNDLALQFAKMMTDRLERHSSVALREVMYRHAGHMRLPGTLDVTDMGLGLFQPLPTRLMKTGQYGATAKSSFVAASMRDLSGQMMSDINSGRLDMFAPIGRDLRAGVPFTEAAIGLATDPESGLSVRVLRFQQESGVRRHTMMTAFEMAGGRWKGGV